MSFNRLRGFWPPLRVISASGTVDADDQVMHQDQMMLDLHAAKLKKSRLRRDSAFAGQVSNRNAR